MINSGTQNGAQMQMLVRENQQQNDYIEGNNDKRNRPNNVNYSSFQTTNGPENTLLSQDDALRV